MAEDLVVSGIRLETDALLSGTRTAERAITQIEQKAAGLDAGMRKASGGARTLADAERRVFTETLQATGSIQKAARAVDDYRKRAEQAASGTARLGKESSLSARSFKLQEGAAASLGRRLAGLAAAYISIFGAIRLARGFVRVNTELQDLQANLQTVTGSAGAASKAFREITDFAKTTPFEIQGLTEAFVRLQAFGAGPTIDQFRGLGNIAAAFSRDITTLSDAMVSAVNTSIEPIRQFGVQAAITGDKMRVSFGGVTKEIPRTTAALSEFLAEMGNTGTFAGAMERRMNTLGGAMSNLSDVVTILAKDIGDQGLNAEIIGVIRELENAVKSSDSFAASIGQGAAGAVRLLSETIRLALPVMNTFSNLLASIGNQSNRIAVPEIAAIRGIDNLDALETRRRQLDSQLQEERRILDEMNANTQGGVGGFVAKFRIDNVFGENADEELAAQTAEVEGLIAALNAVDAKKRELTEIANTPPVEPAALLGLGGGRGGAKKTKEEITDLQRAMDGLAEDLRGIAAMRDALEGTGIDFDANAEAARAYEKALSAVASIEGVSADLVAELAGNYSGLERAVRRATNAEEQREARLAIQRRNAERRRDFLLGVKQRQHEMADQQMLAEIEKQKQLAEDIASSFADAFASIITGTQSVADAFRQMVNEILAQLVRLQIQKAIIEPLMASLFPSPTPGPIDLGGPGGGLPHFAAGGPITAGTAAIVGERGPELFVPSTSGNVVPNHDLGGGGGETIVQFHNTYEIRSIDTREGVQFIRQMQPEIAAAAAREFHRSRGLRNMVKRT